MAKLELIGGRGGPKMRKVGGRRRFDAARQALFFAALAKSCNVMAACRAARVDTGTVYRHRKTNAAFRARWAETVREAYGRLELMMLERMMNGTVRTVTKAGGVTETVHEYPNAIALQLLRLHRGEGGPEAQAEPDEAEVEEARERIFNRIMKLRARNEAAKPAEG